MHFIYYFFSGRITFNAPMNSNKVNTFQVPDISTRGGNSSDLSLGNSSTENEKETWRSSENPRTTILLSLLYLALLTFFGSAVLLAEMHRYSQQTHNVHGFLTILMLTSSTWMLWFGWTSAKNKKIKMYQDHQAGANWLKGMCSLVCPLWVPKIL